MEDKNIHEDGNVLNGDETSEEQSDNEDDEANDILSSNTNKYKHEKWELSL